MICISAALMMLENESDREYLRNLYDEYKHLMYNCAYGVLRDSDAAGDAIGEAIIKLIHNLNKVKTLDGCRLKAYIVSTIKNTSINMAIKRNNYAKHMVLSDDMSKYERAGDEPLGDILLHGIDVGELVRALEQLPSGERNLLYMKYVGEKSDAEIAKIYGVQADSVRAMLTRARRHAREILRGVNNEYE